MMFAPRYTVWHCGYLKGEREMILAKVWLDRESLREQLKECSAAFDQQQEQLDRNAEQIATLRLDASSKWAFLEWRDRAEKAETENAKLRELLRLCKPAVRNVYPSTDPLLEAIDAAMKEEGK